jgi:hypothetical protein
MQPTQYSMSFAHSGSTRLLRGNHKRLDLVTLRLTWKY